MTETVPLDRFPGKVLDGFLIEAPLGHGGMAAVFRARDLSLNRPVAIKVLRSGAVKDEATRSRFLREAKAAGSLQHPNVVQTYRVGETAGVLYIAMQYVGGRSLEKMLKREGRLTARKALSMAKQVAMALEAAHGAGLVHRDIKPANIMVGDDGHVTVMDFGVAKPLKGEVVEMAEFAGTPEYASPEQHGSGVVDTRSDLYSLGVTLYQMLTGCLPFVSETETGLRRRVAEEEPIAVRDVDRRVPRHVAALVARLMSKDPAKRPASARETIREIENVQKYLKMKRPFATAAAALVLVAAAAFAAEKLRSWRPVELSDPIRPAAAGPVADKATPRVPQPTPDDPPLAGIPHTAGPTVLVAEFAGPSGEKEWLAPALCDLLARELAGSGKVVVLPRSRVSQEIARAENREGFAEKIARTHGAQVVVMGSWTSAGDGLQLDVEVLRLTDKGPVLRKVSAVGLVAEFTRTVGPLAENILAIIEARN